MKKKRIKTFFKQSLKDKKVASIVPSSHFLVDKICGQLDYSKKRVILEYGPGEGVITRSLLERMTEDSVLIAIETNRILYKILSELNDSRLKVLNDSAENVKEILEAQNQREADYIISGIPFSRISPSKRDEIIKRSYEVLSPDGKFIAYQLRYSIKRPLERYFDNIRFDFEFLNIPPLFIITAGN